MVREPPGPGLASGEKVFHALSVARPARALLAAPPFEARLVGVFTHACLLATPHGQVLALVLPAAGDGPLSIVVDAGPGVFEHLGIETPVSLSAGRLVLGDLHILLAGAATWEPRPPWERLRSGPALAPGHLARLQALALSRAPVDSLLARLAPRFEPASVSRPPAGLDRVRRAVADLAAGRSGDLSRLAAGARALAGLGGGLTPAGDDLLAGAMLRAWLDGPAPDEFCRVIVDGAAPRTTLLSAALLGAAARGECGLAWHHLLAALEAGLADPLSQAVDAVLAQGHTSGADALAGFLYPGFLP